MSEFLSRLGGAALNDMKGTPLDRILNHLMGGQAGASGLQALVEKLRGAGLGDRVDSWIGTGDNRPIQPQELERAIDGSEADLMAHEAGMERPGLLAVLSQVLPKLVDAMTPQGRVPQRDEDLGQGGLGGLLQSVLGQFGGEGTAGRETPGQGGMGQGGMGQGAAGAMPGSGPAAAPYGGAGGDAGHHAGQGAGGEAGMPRLGPAPTDDAAAPASGRVGPAGAGPERG